MRIMLILGFLLYLAHSGFGYSIQDKAEGWASTNGGTTGGAGGEIVTVSTSEELIKAATSEGKKIILVKKGDYGVGKMAVQSNKSILGLEPGVKVDGTISIVDEVKNIIIRNIAVYNSKHCSGYKACQKGTDAITVSTGAVNIWFDHLDVYDGQDGNLDITKAADFVTATWCKFHYTYSKAHAFSNLIAGSGYEGVSKGKLRITYAYCWWGDRVYQRQPFGRMGKVHLLNNLWTSQNTKDATACGNMLQMLVEYNVYNCNGQAFRPDGGDYKLVGNIGTNTDIPAKDKGTVFTPPYEMSLRMKATEVEARVRAESGNTLTLEKTTALEPEKPQKTPIESYLSASEGGLSLFNPTSSKLSFTAFTANGRTILPTTTIEAGKRLPLSPVPSTIYLKIKGADAGAGALYQHLD